MYFNAGDIAAYVSTIKINDGQLWVEANQEKPTPIFDGDHIRLNKLNGVL